MPIFALFGLDVPNGAEIRAANKPEHAAYISADVAHLRLAGALVDDDDTQCGSLYLIDAESPEAIREWLRNEPYVREGVYESLVIRRITLNPPWGVPEAVPGDALKKLIAANS